MSRSSITDKSRTDPVMQTYYRKHLGKDTKKIIIKVARKLLSRTQAVIKKEIPYQVWCDTIEA